MTIREFAESREFAIVGKLTRKPEHEVVYDINSDSNIRQCKRYYEDEAGNGYTIGFTGGVCITPADSSTVI